MKEKVKKKRLTRAERKRIKLAKRASEELKRCVEAGVFHQQCLAAELETETAYVTELIARIQTLCQPIVSQTTLTEVVTEKEEGGTIEF